jgi:hypothetical protein
VHIKELTMSTYANAPSNVAHAAGDRAWAWLRRSGSSFWNFMLELGERRAGAEMRRLARSYELSQPELAAQLRDCARETERRA